MTVEVGFEAIVDLGNKVDTVNKHLRSAKPIYKRVAGQLLVQAGTTGGTIECTDRPAAGNIWNILKVVIAGADGHTALAGVIVDVYTSTLADQNAPPVPYLVISGGTGNVPSVTTITKQVEWCSPQEEIFGIVYGATPGQQITLSCVIAEYKLEAVQRNWI